MQAGDLRTDSDHSLASYLESFSPILSRSYYPLNLLNRQWLISIESSFSKALEGYAMYNTWKQEICNHLSYGFLFFFFSSSKSLVIVNRGTLCKSCSASYNIAINIANNNFSYVSKTLRVSCFPSKGIVLPRLFQVTKSNISSHRSVSPFFIKEIADRSSYLWNKPFELNFVRRNLLCTMKIVLSSICFFFIGRYSQ